MGVKPCWDRDKNTLRKSKSYLLKTSVSPEKKKRTLGRMSVLEIHHLRDKKGGILEMFLRWLMVNVKEGSKRKISLLEKNKTEKEKKKKHRSKRHNDPPLQIKLPLWKLHFSVITEEGELELNNLIGNPNLSLVLLLIL